MAAEEYAAVQQVAEAIGEDIIAMLTTRTVTSTGIAFVDGGGSSDTITDSNAGFGVFAVGNYATIRGSSESGNNTRVMLTGVAAGTLTVPTATVTAEAAGRSISITASDFIGSPTFSSTVVTEAI